MFFFSSADFSLCSLWFLLRSLVAVSFALMGSLFFFLVPLLSLNVLSHFAGEDPIDNVPVFLFLC